MLAIQRGCTESQMQWIPSYKCCKDYIFENFPCQLSNSNMCVLCPYGCVLDVQVESSRLTEVKTRHADIWYAYVLYHSWHESKKEAIPNSSPFWSMSVILYLATKPAWTLKCNGVSWKDFTAQLFTSRPPLQHSLQLCQHQTNALAEEKHISVFFYL